jgi:peptide/nickel transport system substrate-binding protein
MRTDRRTSNHCRQHTSDQDSTPSALMSRRDFIRIATLAAGTAAVEGLAGGCGPAATATPSAATVKRGGTLKVAYTTDPIAMDPHLAVDIGTHYIAELVYSGLVAHDTQTGIVPDLAETWSFSEDGLACTFNLRRDAFFHNGDQVKASDVAFSLQRVTDPDTGYPYRSSIAEIQSVDILDDFTARVNLSQPVGGLLTFLCFPGLAIVPQSEVEKQGDLSKHPIGSGPFIFESHQPKQMTRLKANPDYYRQGIPYVDALEMHYITDDTARTNALQTNVVDMVHWVPAKDFQMLKDTEGMVAQNWVSSNWQWLGLNTQKEPFNDTRVRQAIAYAIDRQAIVDSVFFGLADPIQGTVIPEWSWAYTPIDKYATRPDPETAKALLQQAGYSAGFTASLKLAADYPQDTKPGPIIQENLKEIGVDIELVTLEFARWIDEVVVAGDYDMCIMDWLSPMVDPDDHLSTSYHSASPMNIQRYSNAEVDGLLERGKHTFDQDERKGIYADLQEILADEVPLVPLVNERRLEAHWDYVKGWLPMRTGMMRYLHETWLDK